MKGWLLYVIAAATSLLEIVLVFAGATVWFGTGTLGLIGATVVTLLGPALVYSSTSGSARGERLGTSAYGPAYAVGVTVSTLAAATALWNAFTDAGTPTPSRVIAGVVAIVVCAALAWAPSALRLEAQRLGLEAPEDDG